MDVHWARHTVKHRIYFVKITSIIRELYNDERS
jgi:hypothetical protein